MIAVPYNLQLAKYGAPSDLADWVHQSQNTVAILFMMIGTNTPPSVKNSMSSENLLYFPNSAHLKDLLSGNCRNHFI